MSDAPSRDLVRSAVCLALIVAVFGCAEPDSVSVDEPSLRPSATRPSATWPSEAWERATPESQGVDPAPLTALDESIRGGEFGHVDRMVVIRNGRLVVDEAYDNDYREISRGLDDALGCGWETCSDPEADLEYNYYHPETHPFYRGREVHSLQSVTKSIAATALGAALFEGAIPGLDAPVLSFFENYDLSGVEPRLHEATLENLLTMRLGIAWHEQDRPLDDTNSTLRLEKSDDWIQFTLDQSMDSDPGEKWAYSSGASQLISGIVKQATGRFIDDYAAEVLFAPLGIEEFHWKKTPQGFPDTEGGLYLEATDLVRIGYLYLHDGVWNGRRILPEGWVEAATARQAETGNAAGAGYGYQWWRVDRDGVEVWAGLGFGGQFLFVLPERQTIGVVNSWNIFDRPQRDIRDGFLEALIEATSDSGE